MKFLILTPSSLIIHDNDKMSKYHKDIMKNIFKLKIARNIVQTPNWKIGTTHWIENWGELTSLSWIINDHVNEKQRKYYTA